MWNEDELSEDDLRSIYGEEAVRLRTNAFLDRLLKRQDEGIAFLDRLLKKMKEEKNSS